MLLLNIFFYFKHYSLIIFRYGNTLFFIDGTHKTIAEKSQVIVILIKHPDIYFLVF